MINELGGMDEADITDNMDRIDVINGIDDINEASGSAKRTSKGCAGQNR